MITMYQKNGVMPRTIGGLIEDIFQNGIQKVWGEENWNERADAPVNIQESEKSYDLQVVAPGLKKEEFKLNVDRNVLTISYEHKEEAKDDAGKWLRSEYKMRSFKRSFTLNDKINASGIGAHYTDGVLHVTLPKKEQAEPTVQSINVS